MFADLELDDDTHEVWRGRTRIELTPTEYKLLRYLMLNARRALSKSQILDHVWEYDFDGDANVVETYISYLRKKIDKLGPPLIHTIRGVGYTLRTPARELSRRDAARAAAARARRAGARSGWRSPGVVTYREQRSFLSTASTSSSRRRSRSDQLLARDDPSPTGSPAGGYVRDPQPGGCVACSRDDRRGSTPRSAHAAGEPPRVGPSHGRTPPATAPQYRPCVRGPRIGVNGDRWSSRSRSRDVDADAAPPAARRAGRRDRACCSRSASLAWWVVEARAAAARADERDRRRDRGRRPLAARSNRRRAHRGRPARPRAQRDARHRSRQAFAERTRLRSAAAPVRRRRVARAAHAAHVDPRLRRAVPPRRGRAARRPREGDAPHRGRGDAHGRARRRPAPPRAPRSGPARSNTSRSTSRASSRDAVDDLRAVAPDRPVDYDVERRGRRPRRRGPPAPGAREPARRTRARTRRRHAGRRARHAERTPTRSIEVRDDGPGHARRRRGRASSSGSGAPTRRARGRAAAPASASRSWPRSPTPTAARRGRHRTRRRRDLPGAPSAGAPPVAEATATTPRSPSARSDGAARVETLEGRAYLHDELAEVVAGEEAHERLGRAVDAVEHVLAVT